MPDATYWMQYVEALDEFPGEVTAWEADFIADILDDPPTEFSERQQATIRRMVKQYLREDI